LLHAPALAVTRYSCPRFSCHEILIPWYHFLKFEFACYNFFKINMWMFTTHVFTIPRIFRTRLEKHLEQKINPT
jgi:hypothetical protein